MFTVKNYEGDALAITDEQVAADWRMGLLRSLAKVLTEALPRDSETRYGGSVKGSNREHVTGTMGMKFCPLVEIYEVREDKGHQYLFSTFGGSTDEVTILKAKASCKCGRLVKHPVELEVPIGSLISQVTNTDEPRDEF
jgi:hypothetical protein